MSGKLTESQNLESETRVSDKPFCNQALRDQAIAWLLQVREAPADANLQQAFADWLAADTAHRLAYEQAQAQWAWMERFKDQRFRARDEALRYRPSARHPVQGRLAVCGAAAAILLGVGLALFSPQGWYGMPHHYSVGKGQKQTIALSDGSSLEMNTDTELRVRFNRHERRVELLRGEAFFNVIHDTERPFVVHAANVSIRDIGTAFDVYRQAEQVSIAVQEGVVEVEGRQQRQQLNAGQQMAIGNDNRFIPLAQADVASATAWRQGLLVFRGRRLAEVLAEIARYHDVQIRLPDQKLAELKVNGSFRTEQLDNMLNAVANLLPLNVKRVGEREIVLESAGKS